MRLIQPDFMAWNVIIFIKFWFVVKIVCLDFGKRQWHSIASACLFEDGFEGLFYDQEDFLLDVATSALFMTTSNCLATTLKQSTHHSDRKKTRFFVTVAAIEMR